MASEKSSLSAFSSGQDAYEGKGGRCPFVRPSICSILRFKHHPLNKLKNNPWAKLNLQGKEKPPWNIHQSSHTPPPPYIELYIPGGQCNEKKRDLSSHHHLHPCQQRQYSPAVTSWTNQQLEEQLRFKPFYFNLKRSMNCGQLAVTIVVVQTGCFSIPQTEARQVPLSMGFPRQEYWSGLLFSSPGDLPDPGIEPTSPAWQADSLPPSLLGSLLHISALLEAWMDSLQKGESQRAQQDSFRARTNV